MSTSYRIEERFAPLTRSVSELVNQATPAASKLWVWLRQEFHPEKPFTIHLKEVAVGLDYSVRWLRKALVELESLQLVEQVEQWWGQTYSLVIHNPGQRVVQKNDQCGQENDQCGQKTSQKQPSKAHSVVPIQERKKEEENNGCDVVDGQEGDGCGEGEANSIQPGLDLNSHPQIDLTLNPEPSHPNPNPEPTDPNPNLETQPSSQDALNDEPLYAEVQRVAPGFNPKVYLEALSRFGATQIWNALSAVKEQIERGNTRKPAATLYAAIFRQFTSNGAKQERRQSLGEGRSPVVDGVSVSEPVRELGRGSVSEPRGLVSVAETVGAIAAVSESCIVSSAIAAVSESCVVSPVTEEPENLSEVLVRISIALQQKGWSREHVQGVLWERYGVKSLHYLTSVQLLDWLGYLSSAG